ncbi:MAG: glycosyltransferase, partial [Muribaculaceae bacterium]|nr:glycosyltransferase [Muribaculaceae bacterium]
MKQEEVGRLMKRHKICVIVPTYNNSGTLAHVLTDLLDYTDDVIVVNDGSTDSTAEILEGFRSRADIVSYPVNKGKGNALREGFRHALQRGYDYAVTIDSDGQHYASDLPLFVRAVAEYPGSLIVGERDLSNVDISGKSSFANKFSNFWFTVQTAKRLKDTQTGYRCYPLKRLSGLKLITSRYEAELELLVFAAWKGVEIKSIPISVYYPPREERVSHFRPGKDFTRISILNTILCFAALFYGLPRGIYNLFRDKKIFKSEVSLFTRYGSKRGGKKRDCGLTLGRIARSLYALAYFIPRAILMRAEVAIKYKGKDISENERFSLHKKLQSLSRSINRNYPCGKVSYENGAKEKFKKPAIIICNHQSHLDLPTIMAVIPNLVFITNDRVWNNPIYGNVIHAAESLPASEGIDNLIPRIRSLVQRGYSVVIFPEGTRSVDGEIKRFHKGAFYLSQQLGIDILPMVVHGVNDYLPKGDSWLRKGDITLRVLPRIFAEELSKFSLMKQASFFRGLCKRE